MLERILAHKRDEVARRKSRVSLREIERRAARAPAPPSLAAALRRGDGVAVIAEIKRASPSRGVIRGDACAAGIAAAYAAAGAAAVSVLTDTRFFGGCLEDLAAVAQTVKIPVLRKDFIIDAYQLYEARAAGAAAVLLIVAALGDEELRRLYALAGELGLASLVEVHTQEELERALGLGAGIIGINNRDLRTLRTDLATTARLLPLVPPGTVVVSESGVRSRADVAWLASLGVDAVLVGEALMAAPDPGRKLAELAGRGGGADGQG